MKGARLMRTARVCLGAVAVLGLLLAATPVWLFRVCPDPIKTAGGGLVPMRCAWSARMLVALGVLVAVVAIIGLLSNERAAVRASAWGVSAVLVTAMLVPTKLIGVCSSPTHPCRAGTLPAVLIVSGLALTLAVAAGLLVSVGGSNGSTGSVT